MNTLKQLRDRAAALKAVDLGDGITVYVKKMTAAAARGFTEKAKGTDGDESKVFALLIDLTVAGTCEADGTLIFNSAEDVLSLEAGTPRIIGEAILEWSGLTETAAQKKAS